MPRIGSTTAPADAHSRIGNYRQQNAYALTAPVACTVTSLGAYIKGLSGYGSISYRLCIWRNGGSPDVGNALLGQTALLTATAAALDPGNLDKVTHDLITPVELAAGDAFFVGIASNTSGSSAHCWGVRTTGTAYYRTLSQGDAWPASMKNYDTETGGNVVAWVENYIPLGSGKVRRSSAWSDAASVQIRRGGAWVDATSVQVRRSGAWVDAS